MAINKKDCYIQVFMGTTYNIGRPSTIGALKEVLEQIVSDLPVDNSLEVSEVFLRDSKIEYTLENGINQ